MSADATEVINPATEQRLGTVAASSAADVDQAVALVAFRGSAPDGPGYWFAPTVLAPVGIADPAFTDEVLGPVVAVVAFDDEKDAVRIANDTQYGLSGSIWTRDVGRALRMVRAVEAGNLSVNSNSSVRYSTPFGGFSSPASDVSWARTR